MEKPMSEFAEQNIKDDLRQLKKSWRKGKECEAGIRSRAIAAIGAVLGEFQSADDTALTVLQADPTQFASLLREKRINYVYDHDSPNGMTASEYTSLLFTDIQENDPDMLVQIVRHAHAVSLRRTAKVSPKRPADEKPPTLAEAQEIACRALMLPQEDRGSFLATKTDAQLRYALTEVPTEKQRELILSELTNERRDGLGLGSISLDQSGFFALWPTTRIVALVSNQWEYDRTVRSRSRTDAGNSCAAHVLKEVLEALVITGDPEDFRKAIGIAARLGVGRLTAMCNFDYAETSVAEEGEAAQEWLQDFLSDNMEEIVARRKKLEAAQERRLAEAEQRAQERVETGAYVPEKPQIPEVAIAGTELVISDLFDE